MIQETNHSQFMKCTWVPGVLPMVKIVLFRTLSLPINYPNTSRRWVFHMSNFFPQANTLTEHHGGIRSRVTMLPPTVMVLPRSLPSWSQQSKRLALAYLLIGCLRIFLRMSLPWLGLMEPAFSSMRIQSKVIMRNGGRSVTTMADRR